MTVVDLQVSPAVLGWPEVRRAAVDAELAGFGAFHVFDHLAGATLGGDSMIECFALLGALAEATTSITLGTMVANVWNRQVGTLVTAAASIVELSGRPFLFGVGAGAAPTSRWADEQHVVGAHVESEPAGRHERVAQVLDLARRTWSPDRPPALATFPLPRPTPTMIVGVNSVALSRLAGTRADGINVPWNHPRRDEFLATADQVVGERAFLRTAYLTYDEALLDPEHPTRVEMAEREIDRLVLAAFDAAPRFPT